MEASANRAWVTESLRSALQALASPGQSALGRFPVDVVRSDELALEFDNFYRAFVGNFGAELSPSQQSALQAVDQQLRAMSNEGPYLWTDDNVCSHPAWEHVRSAATDALRALKWAFV
jgi:hypothetical protein